ncbi:MAG: PAS domain S-box protein, partial [Candidatus Sumerlaeia bacterium]
MGEKEKASPNSPSSQASLSDQTAWQISAIEQLEESVILLDGDGCIHYTNPAFEKMTGYSRGEITGKSMDLLRSTREEDHPAFEAFMDHARDEKAWSGLLTCTRKSGVLFEVSFFLSPWKHEAGDWAGSIVCARDVTLSRSRERELQRLRARQGAISLADDLAYSLRNLLGVIVTNSEMALEEREAQKSVLREYLNQILEACKQGQQLSRHVLALSPLQQSRLETRSLQRFLEDFVREFAAEHPHQQAWLKVEQQNARVPLAASLLADMMQMLCRRAIEALGQSVGQWEFSIVETHPEDRREEADFHQNNPLPDDMDSSRLLELRILIQPGDAAAQRLEQYFQPFRFSRLQGMSDSLSLAMLPGIDADRQIPGADRAREAVSDIAMAHRVMQLHHGAFRCGYFADKGLLVRLIFAEYQGA